MESQKADFPFERLQVWQHSRQFVGAVFRITAGFPKSEQFGLVSQINRAVVSVACNLAEGASRLSRKDQSQFSQLAFSSLMELVCLIKLSTDLAMLGAEQAAALLDGVRQPAPRISRLRDSQVTRASS